MQCDEISWPGQLFPVLILIRKLCRVHFSFISDNILRTASMCVCQNNYDSYHILSIYVNIEMIEPTTELVLDYPHFFPSAIFLCTFLENNLSFEDFRRKLTFVEKSYATFFDLCFILNFMYII